MHGTSILGALLLFGFAPTGDPIQVGEDAPRLIVTPGLQVRLQDREVVRDFRERRGDWFVRFDERDGSPRLLWGPGVEAREVDGLAHDIAALAGVAPHEIVLERQLDHGSRSAWRYRQVHRGARVEGGVLDLFAEDGRISVAQSSLHPDVRGDVRPGEWILVGTGARGELTFTPVSRTASDDRVVYRDRAGEVVHQWSQRFYLDIELEERTAGGPLVRMPAREVLVTGLDGTFLTDALGGHPLAAPYEVSLEGPYLEVFHDPNPDPVLIPQVLDEVLNTGADLTASSAAVQTYFHVVRDWLVATDPNNPWIPDLVPATVDLERDTCNAFYTNGTINFHDEQGNCIALGRIADVIYHEYGHGIHHYGLLGGVFAGDISEGSADFVSATLNDDPYTGVGNSGPGSWIRECETDRVYPDHYVGEVHNDGLIWASFLWDLREQDGAASTDLLFLEALTFGPTLTESWLSVLAADDDDADPTNGTPNDCSLLVLLDEHGIGPGPLGVVAYTHDPVADQPTGAGPATVALTLSAVMPDCSDLDVDSVTLHWALDEPGARLDDLVFTEVVPTRVGNAYSAEIPAQLPGTRIAYYLRWATTDGAVAVTTHDGDGEGLYRYWVGDQAEVSCEGFEAGDGGFLVEGGSLDGRIEDGIPELEVYAPLPGEPWSPPAAAAGTFVFGTVGDEDDEYLPDNAWYASGPPLAVPTQGSRSLLHLRYQRWLSAEGSEYDIATLVLDGEERWRNPVQPALVDRAWTPQVLDLRDRPDLGGDLAFTWTFQTDGGLEYGGWNLDQVCLVALAEPERHYRASALVATDDGVEIGLSWVQPAVRPLFATAVVRHSDHTPTSLEDGVVVDLDFAPLAGASKAVIDPDAAPGQPYHYAVFAADSALGWYLSTVAGENADDGLIPVDPPVVDDDGTEAEPGPAETPKEGCGCASADPTASWLLLGLLLMVRRPRRS